MEANENENTTLQTLWDATKSVLRGKYIATQAYLKKQEKSQIQTPRALEAEQQRNSKASRRGEIIKIRAEINDQTKQQNKNRNKNKTVEHIDETNSWFFEKIKKIVKTLARFLKTKTKTNTNKQTNTRGP